MKLINGKMLQTMAAAVAKGEWKGVIKSTPVILRRVAKIEPEGGTQVEAAALINGTGYMFLTPMPTSAIEGIEQLISGSDGTAFGAVVIPNPEELIAMQPKAAVKKLSASKKAALKETAKEAKAAAKAAKVPGKNKKPAKEIPPTPAKEVVKLTDLVNGVTSKADKGGEATIKTEPKKTYKPKPATVEGARTGSNGAVFGEFSSTSVIRFMGAKGYSVAEAEYCMKKLKVPVNIATIRIQLGKGKNHADTMPPAKLSGEQAKQLKELKGELAG